MARSKGWIQPGGFRHGGALILALICFGFLLLACLCVWIACCCCVSWSNTRSYSAMQAGNEECPQVVVGTSKEKYEERQTEGKPRLESPSPNTGSSNVSDAERLLEGKLHLGNSSQNT